MATTSEQQLQQKLAEGASDNDFVKQLSKQISVKRTSKSFWEPYVTGNVSPNLSKVHTVDPYIEAGQGV